MLRRSIGLVVLVASLSAGPALAASMYEFGFDSSTYEVAPGQNLTVSVYLYETITAGDTSVLATAKIMSTGVRISYDSTSTATDPVTLASVANPIQGGPAFTDESGDFGDWVTTYSTPSEFTSVGTGAANPIAGLELSSWTEVPGVEVAGSGGRKYSILLGTVTLTAGDILEETTTLKASDLFTNRDDTYTYSPLNVLDDVPIWSSTAQITVVPEPSAWIGLSSMALMAGIFWKIRSRRRK